MQIYSQQKVATQHTLLDQSDLTEAATLPQARNLQHDLCQVFYETGESVLVSFIQSLGQDGRFVEELSRDFLLEREIDAFRSFGQRIDVG